MSDRDVAVAIARDAAASSSSTASPTEASDVLNSSETQSGTMNMTSSARNCTASRPSPLLQTDGVHFAIANNSRILYEPNEASPVNTNIPIVSKGPTGFWQKRSNSGLTHQLSQKLSSTFGNPTIVHRPNLRTRPTLLSLHGEPLRNPILQDDQLPSPQGSTAPSSYNTSGSISTGDPSTTKTSLESNIASLRSVKGSDGQEKSNGASNIAFAEEIVREKPLSPIEEAPLVVTPTVVTVETTAIAKIFFETHFNSLLAGHASPRSIRRHNLELHLESQTMSEEQRQHERVLWAALESEHLRQTRVLKGKISEMNKGSGVAVAGYEVVRILGKGSFGVVRLVREKGTVQYRCALKTRRCPSTSNQKHAPHEGPSDLKVTAAGAPKATLDSQRAAQRRLYQNDKKEVYAMKVIRKSDMLRNCQEGHLRAERDFLVASETSKWVVPLVASF